MRFLIVVIITVLMTAFAAGYLGLDPFPTVVICLAVAFVTALVQKVFIPLANACENGIQNTMEKGE